MNNLFKCKLKTKEKMEIEHVTAKEAFITGMKMRRWEEQSIHNLQKLNPYSFELSAIYKLFTIFSNSQRLEMS